MEKKYLALGLVVGLLAFSMAGLVAADEGGHEGRFGGEHGWGEHDNGWGMRYPFLGGWGYGAYNYPFMSEWEED